MGDFLYKWARIIGVLMGVTGTASLLISFITLNITGYNPVVDTWVIVSFLMVAIPVAGAALFFVSILLWAIFDSLSDWFRDVLNE